MAGRGEKTGGHRCAADCGLQRAPRAHSGGAAPPPASLWVGPSLTSRVADLTKLSPRCAQCVTSPARGPLARGRSPAASSLSGSNSQPARSPQRAPGVQQDRTDHVARYPRCPGKAQP